MQWYAAAIQTPITTRLSNMGLLENLTATTEILRDVLEELTDWDPDA